MNVPLLLHTFTANPPSTGIAAPVKKSEARLARKMAVPAISSGSTQIFPVLRRRAQKLALTLSGGERQMLAIGRGLMTRPKLFMLDEPSYGLAPLMVTEIFRVIRALREQGTTILLVEQNVKHTLGIADRAYLLENGKIVLDGTCKKFLEDDYVRQAYLGL
jgi:branched-chain amino acid transport system ATP-binding protein